MSCHVATFAKDLGEVMSCRVATFARNLETYDINICLNYRDIYAKPNRHVRCREVKVCRESVERTYQRIGLLLSEVKCDVGRCEREWLPSGRRPRPQCLQC